MTFSKVTNVSSARMTFSKVTDVSSARMTFSKVTKLLGNVSSAAGLGIRSF